MKSSHHQETPMNTVLIILFVIFLATTAFEGYAEYKCNELDKSPKN